MQLRHYFWVQRVLYVSVHGDVRKAGLPVGPGATVPLGTAVGCAVWTRFGAARDVVSRHGLPVGAEATVFWYAAGAVHFRSVIREGQVCQSVQGRLYLWAQQ